MSRLAQNDVANLFGHDAPKSLTPFIFSNRQCKWPPDFSVSPLCVPFSSSHLFGNRSQRLAPHTQDIRMTRMVRSDQAQNLNKSPGAYMPCVDQTIAATKKIWPLVLTQADGAPSTRVVIIKLGAHMQKGGSQLSPLFLFIEWQIRSSTILARTCPVWITHVEG